MAPMAPPLTDTERAQIRQLIEAGHGCVQIAKTVGRSNDTISRIAKAMGHTFGESNLARAHAARSAYSADRRAALAAKATERAGEMLERMAGRYLVFNFGGRDNTYEEHELAQPPTEAQRALAATFRDLMRTVLDVDRHDNADKGVSSAFDDWLQQMTGGQ